MYEPLQIFRHHGHQHLELPAELSAFIELEEWIEKIAFELAVPDKIRKHLLIAADEIFTNIACYSYPGRSGKTRVKIAYNTEQDQLIMTFSDTGIPYNPLEQAEPDTHCCAENRPIGGLGIFMVKKLMDSLTYTRRGDRNILTLTKILHPAPPK